MPAQTLTKPPTRAREQHTPPPTPNVFPERKLGARLVLYVNRQLYTGGNGKVFSTCVYRRDPLAQENFIVASGCEQLSKGSAKVLCAVQRIGNPMKGVRAVYVDVIETR